jgi:hypothetical protein
VTAGPVTFGLVIGINTEAWSANLDSWSAITTSSKAAAYSATPGLVFNTSTTASRNAAAADAYTLFGCTGGSNTVLAGNGTCPTISSAFSGITSATNTTAAMLVGAGSSLNYTSTGTINASSLGGNPFTAYVQGAAALTTATAMPYVTSAGTLAQDATYFNYTSPGAGGILHVPNLYAPTGILVGSFNLSNQFAMNPGGVTAGDIEWYQYTAPAAYAMMWRGNAAKSICIGPNNVTSSCTANLDITNKTGSTSVHVGLGVADSASTVTVTNDGTSKSAGYQSSDGSAGVTVTVCTSFKNGLCVAGT